MNNGNNTLRLLEKLIIRNNQNQKEDSIISIPIIDDFNARIKKNKLKNKISKEIVEKLNSYTTYEKKKMTINKTSSK